MAKKRSKEKEVVIQRVGSNKFLIAVIVGLIIVIAFLIGKSQGLYLGAKDTAIPLPTISLTPSITPTPTQPIQQRTYIPPVDSDPPVLCNISPNCGGGTKPLKQSECANSTCCQIGDKWTFYIDKTQCVRDQDAYNQQHQKVPVYVSSARVTYYCSPEGVDAVKSADQALQNASSAYQTCLSNSTTNFGNCIKGCTDPNSYSSCSSLCNSAYGTQTCYYDKSYGDGLDNVINQYCK